MVFDAYVFFGTEEQQDVASGECTDWSMLTPEQRLQNESLRSVLALMGVQGKEPLTRIDLAILAQNKLFMGNVETEAFLDTLWRTRGGNGQWLDTKMNASPRQKYFSQNIGQFALLFLYM